jgi:hypothetical protein
MHGHVDKALDFIAQMKQQRFCPYAVHDYTTIHFDYIKMCESVNLVISSEV